jgi:hypothetical protein
MMVCMFSYCCNFVYQAGAGAVMSQRCMRQAHGPPRDMPALCRLPHHRSHPGSGVALASPNGVHVACAQPWHALHYSASCGQGVWRRLSVP